MKKLLLINMKGKLSSILHKFVFLSPFVQQVGLLSIARFRYLKAFVTKANIASSCDYGFVYIVGSGRSGNTLLRKLLMEKARIYIPPESYVIPSQVRSSFESRTLDWGDKVELFLAKYQYHKEFGTFGIGELRDFADSAKQWELDRRYVDILCYEFYLYLARHKGYDVVWVGDKTPANTSRLGFIKLFMPKAKYIYIERDPIDVVSSYLESGIYNSLEDAAERWVRSRRSWRLFKKGIECDDFVEVSYENMVVNPAGVIEAIVKKFDIPFDPVEKIGSSKLGDVDVYKHHANVLSTPNTKSIGKGKVLLSKDQQNIVLSLVGME